MSPRKKSSAPKGKKPPVQIGMSHRTLAAAALVLARPAASEVLARLSGDVAARRQAIAELEARLRGEGSVLDFDADSLQNRLLRYFESELGFANARRQLELADKGRRDLLWEVERAGLLGLHPGNRELHDLVRGFDNYDLHLLNLAVLAANPSEEMKRAEIADVIMRKVRGGRGEDVIKYMAARIQHHQRRMQPEEGRNIPMATLEVFNPVLVVLGWMWTEPSCPMWMMPSAAAIQVIADGVGTRLSTAAFNRLVTAHKLHRVGQPVLDKFLSIKRRDARCLELRQEIERAAGILLAQVRRGRRPGT